jgi:DNA-binding response OmpR family regulator
MTQVALGIVEADEAQGERLAGFFADQGFAVERHRHADHLLGRPSLRPLDLLLIGGEAEPAGTLAALRRLREESRLPAVVLGGADEISQVLLLEAGADDVVPRGLPLRVLLARLRAILRRAEWGAAPDAGRCVTVNGWRLVADRRQFLRPDDSECTLTTAEFDLLRLLLERRGRTISRDDIAAAVFRRPFRAEDRTVDNLVLRLRRKLGPRQQDAIKTVRGAGYMFVGFSEDDPRVA